MDNAIRRHLGRDIAKRERLTGGFTFETWLLTLSDGEKVVFRAQEDFVTGGGRQIVVAEVLRREKFFYDRVNEALGRTCPRVYVIDGSREQYGKAFCVMEYMEGAPLNRCFPGLEEREKQSVLRKIGEMAGRINRIELEAEHPYLAGRGSWMEFIVGRLRERLTPLERSGLIASAEANAIAELLRSCNMVEARRFLHLDMRRINMIYRKGEIFLLDAENCEFGDPLWELATIDVGNELEPALIAGYREAYGSEAELDSTRYLCYKMERQALVTNVFLHEATDDPAVTRYHIERFQQLKNTLLKKG